MQVDLGPIEASSARAWLGYAQEVLARLRAEAVVPEDVAVRFEEFLDAWTEAAADDPFRWSAAIDADLVEYLLNAFHRVAVRLEDEARARGSRLMPEAAAPFYRMLVTQLLDELEKDDPTRSEFVEHLRNFWPLDTP